MCLSLSDPTAVVQGKGVDLMDEVREFIKKVLATVIGRLIYDLLKFLFEDDDT